MSIDEEKRGGSKKLPPFYLSNKKQSLSLLTPEQKRLT